jgi:hypothetical protein
VQADLRGHTEPFAALRDRRVATTRADAETAVAMDEVISEWWSGLRLCGIAMLTHTADDVPAQLAVAIGDSLGIPVRAFDAEDAALSWLRGLLETADRNG